MSVFYFEGRHKDAFRLLVDKKKPEETTLVIALENIQSKTGLYIQTNNEYLSEGIEFKKSNILYGKLRPYLSKVYLAEDEGVAVGDFYVYEINKSLILPEYAKFLMMTTNFTNYAEANSTGAKMPRISSQKVENFPIKLPALNEQDYIVGKLKEKMNLILETISVLNTKKELYIKYRKSILNEKVFQSPDSSLQNVNKIEDCWFGEIPKNWPVKRLAEIYEERNVKVSDKDYMPLSVTKGGIVPQLDTVAKTIHNDNRKLVLKGDFVINSRSDRKGSSGLSKYDGSVSVINIVLKPLIEVEPLYMEFLFKSQKFYEEYYRVGRGIVDDLWTTKFSQMRMLKIPLPSLEEQQKIAKKVNSDLIKVDKIINEIESLISYYNENLQALIDETIYTERLI